MSLNNLFKDLLMYKNFYYKYKAMDTSIIKGENEDAENVDNLYNIDNEKDKIINLLDVNVPKPISEILDETTENELEIVDKLKTEIINPNILGEGKNDRLWLQLGDIIQLVSPENEKLDNRIFFIDYINDTKIVVIENETLEKIVLTFANGVIENGIVKKISILNREESPSYAIQNSLIPSTWIDVVFDDLTVTGLITNLEEDMIEVRLHPDNDTIYINFDYKGLPEELGIKQINIRDEPEMPLIQEDPGLPLEGQQDQGKEEEKEGEIIYGKKLEPIRQMLEMDQRYFKFSIEEQTNDFLEVLLSKVPTIKRSDSILNNFNTIITRYKQLREYFSVFDKNKNIAQDAVTGKPFIFHDHNWKPLAKSLLNFDKKLFWILFVGKNVKNVFNQALGDDKYDSNSDVNILDINSEILHLMESIENYDSNTVSLDQNRYIELYKKINRDFTPFVDVDEEALKDVIYKNKIMTDLTMLVNNSNNFMSSAVKSNQIGSYQYGMLNLNTGLKYISQTKLSNTTRTNHHELTPNDILSLKSIVTLPEPVMHFSKTNLPGTNILDRSNLASHFLQYWQLFKSNFIVNTVTIDDLNSEIAYSENNFINDVKNFELSTMDNLNSRENYQKYLNDIIPKTRILFNLIKNKINDKLSFFNIVEYLEPFLIYPEDITYMQYVDINNFINGKNGQIARYAKNAAFRKNLLNKLLIKFRYNKHEPRIFSSTIVQSAYPEIGDMREKLISGYFSTFQEEVKEISYKYTHSELIKMMMEGDFGKMYSSAVSLSTIDLIVPVNISEIIQEDKEAMVERIVTNAETNSCKTYVIAKKYSSVDELDLDNGNDIIFFDKEFDDVDYSIIESLEEDFYKKNNVKRVNVPTEDFLKFAVEKLQSKYKYDEKDAPYIAESLLNRAKKVLNGHYAVVTYVDEVSPEFAYYIRENSEWINVPENEVPPAFLDNQLLCNIQPTCVSSKKKVDLTCNSIDQIVDKSESSLLDTMVKQFEADYMLSMEEISDELKQKYDNSLLTLIYKRFTKYNQKTHIYKYNLGLQVQESEIVLSPYSKYLDLIMAKTNIIEKNQLIIFFCDNFTRKANVEQLDIVTGEFENDSWFYCKDTNIKLIPSFLHEIAVSIIYDNNYNDVITQIIKRCGTISDDGDNWVDKNSGRIIKLIDFDVDEGYTEEGFKMVSREILEQDAGKNVLSSAKIVSKHISQESKIINNIINGISSNMKINISDYHDFIISKTTEIYAKIRPSETDYNITIEEASKKGKIILETYEDFATKILLNLTLGCFLIVTQISIPSVKTKYSVAGCFRSFEGYPVGSSGDLSALTYLACVTIKMKSSSNPWKMLPKSKTTMIGNIQQYINEYLMKDDEILRKISEKNEYILSKLYLTEDILQEHNIFSWGNFLPSLKKIRTKNVIDVSEDFMQRMIDKFKTGNPDQTQDIEIIESKIIKFSMAMQELIQKIVESEELLMIDKLSKEPQTENSCCNNSFIKTTLMYFVEKNKDINLYNMIVQKFSKHLHDIKMLTTSNLFLSKVDTKMKTYSVKSLFNETTIYSAFVKYCNFKTTVPNDPEIIALYGEKPDYLLFEDSIAEIVQKLKSDNRNYTNEQLLRLLQIVNKKNILNRSNPVDERDEDENDIKFPLFSNNNLFMKLLTKLDIENNDKIINSKLQSLLKEYLDIYSINDKYIGNDIAPIINIITSLKKVNGVMKTKIVDFIKQYNKSQLSGSVNIAEFLTNLTKYKSGDIFNEQNMVNYIKNCIHSIGKVFPSMVCENADYKIKAPKYWGLSKNHDSQLKIISTDIFEPMQKHYQDINLKKLLKNIQKISTPSILLSNIIPLMEKSTFNMQTSILLMEHCFLTILVEYINLTNDDSIISIDTFEEEDEASYNVTQTDKNIFKKKIALLLSDYFKILNNSKKNISMTYDEIMDNVFKLKEAEKNRMRKRAEDLGKEKLQVDNEFKEHKIGFWSKGNNARFYDGDIYDEEFEIMQELNEKENRLAKHKNKPKQGVVLQDMNDLDEEEDAQRRIDNEEGELNMDEDWDDGDYYGEDQ